MNNFAVLPLLGLLSLLVLHRFFSRPKSDRLQTQRENTWIAFGFLLLAYLIPLITLEPRGAPMIVDEGLSQSNLIRVSASLVLIAYSVYLLKYKSVWVRLWHWPSFLIMLLFLLYLASTFWSVWPEATLFRSLEVFAYFTVALFLATEKNGYRRIYFLLLAVMVSTFVLQGTDFVANVSASGIYRSATSNQLSLIAAAYILLHSYLFPRRITGYVFGLAALLAFGSTSTIAAFMVALGIFLFFYLAGRRARAAGIGILILGVLAFVLSLVNPSRYPIIMSFAVNILGRDEHHVIGATGRWVLWEVYFQEFRGQWMGSGFWAAERLFAVELHSLGVWQAINAHNGFWSAWIGGGLAAVLLLGGVYVSVVRELFRNSSRELGLGLALTMLLLLNSLTYPGIGGAASTWYFVFALVIALSINRPGYSQEACATFTNNTVVKVLRNTDIKQ